MSSPSSMSSAWAPDTWRARRAAQQPDWPDADALDASLDELRRMPPLVFAGEALELTDALAAVGDEWPTAIARVVKKVRLEMLGILRARLETAGTEREHDRERTHRSHASAARAGARARRIHA